MAKKIKISKRTGIIMSEVKFGINGKVDSNSINMKEGNGREDRPYTFADFTIDSFGHKLKIKTGGSRPENLYVYDFENGITEKIDYKKNFVSNKKRSSLIGVKYSTTDIDGENIEGTKCDFDFANDLKEVVTDGYYEVGGKIDFKRFKSDNGDVKVSKDLKVSFIKNTTSEEEVHHFDIKNFLFTGVSDKKYADGFILGYSEIIAVRFEIGNEGLAETLANKKMVKPYTLMSVVGIINNKPKIEVPKKESPKEGKWGEVTVSYGMVGSFSFMEMVILKVDPSTLNHGYITEEILAEAIKKTNEVDDQYNAPVKDGKWGTEEKTPKIKEVSIDNVKDDNADDKKVTIGKTETAKVEDDDFDWDDED